MNSAIEFQDVDILFAQPGRDGRKAMREALDDNDLEKATGGDKAGAKQTSPKETISLSYGAIEWTYSRQ